MKVIVKGLAGDREVVVKRRAEEASSPGSTFYEVLIDGRVVEVNAAAVSDGALGGGLHSLLIGGAQHEISVAPRDTDGYWVALRGGGGERIEVVDPLTHLAQTSRGGAGAQGPSQVKAYMPGRVAAILVAEGDQVEEGQGVLVLEAMKMENEIQAEQAGTVRRIHVEAGQAVEGGDRLFDLE